MELKDFILAVFENKKDPSKLRGIKPIKSLEEIKENMILYFINRRGKKVSSLEIERFEKINGSLLRIKEGGWLIGEYIKGQGYNFLMEHFILQEESKSSFVLTQERLDKNEVYGEFHSI